MGLETILLVLGVVIVIAAIMGFAKGRRSRSPTEPVAPEDKARGA